MQGRALLATALSLWGCSSSDAPSTPIGDASSFDADATADTSVADASAVDSGDAGPWTPSALDQKKTLALWLEGSASNVLLNQGTVAIWKDLSSNHNDAKASGNKTAVVVPAAFHGHDAIDLSPVGCTMVIADASSLQFAADEIFVAMIARVASGTGYFFSKAKTSPSQFGPQYASGLEVFAANATVDGGVETSPGAHVDPMNAVAWSGSVFDDSSYHLVTLRRTKSSLELTVDARPAQTATTGATDVSMPGTNVTLGAFRYGNFMPPTEVDLAELVIVHDKSGIANGDANDLVTYLKAKYGL